MIKENTCMKDYTNMTKQNSSAKHLALLKIFALCAVLVLTVLLISACPNAGTQNNGTGGQPLFPGDKEYMLSAGSTTVRFIMKSIAAVHGGALGNSGHPDNMPHNVNLTAYLIGETEVTQELWQLVMGTNPSQFQNGEAAGENQKKRPVEKMTWLDAVKFCNKLTEKVLGGEHAVYTISGSNVTQNLSKKGFRLPTEAEWEFAARGGNVKIDAWKYAFAGTQCTPLDPSDFHTRKTDINLDQYGWYRGNSGQKTHAVGIKKPNRLRLYDMSGNVAEWCSDLTIDEMFLDSTDNSFAIVRGGSWSSPSCKCFASSGEVSFLAVFSIC